MTVVDRFRAELARFWRQRWHRLTPDRRRWIADLGMAMTLRDFQPKDKPNARP